MSLYHACELALVLTERIGAWWTVQSIRWVEWADGYQIRLTANNGTAVVTFANEEVTADVAQEFCRQALEQNTGGSHTL